MGNKLKPLITIILFITIFTAQKACFAWDISGAVYGPDWADGSPPEVLGGAYTYVTLILTDTDGNEIARKNTFPAGTYTFTGLEKGKYTVTPSKLPWEFNPSNQTLNINNADIVGVDFQRTNRPPFIQSILPITLKEGSYTEYRIKATDPDGDNVFLFSSPSGLPAGAALNEILGDFKWIPDYDQEGTYSVSFKAGDYYVNGLSQAQTMTIIVNDNPSPGELKIVSTRQQGPAPLYIEFEMESIPSAAIPCVIANYPKSIWWDFGDGAMALWPSPKKTFVEPRNYNVNLKLIDSNGNELKSAQTTIQVGAEPTPSRKLYLDPINGDDVNDGLSELNAWKTLRHAVDELLQGDTLFLRDGIHDITTGKLFSLWNSGAPDEWITITAYPDENPIIRAEESIGIYGNFIKFSNLEFTTPDPNAYYWAMMEHGGAHLILENNKFHNAWEYIRASGADLVMRNNEFWQEYTGDIDQPEFSFCRSRGSVWERNIFHWTDKVLKGGGGGILFKGWGSQQADIFGNIFVGEPNPQVSSAAITFGGLLSPKTTSEWESVDMAAHDNLFFNWPGGIDISHARDISIFNNSLYLSDLDDSVINISGVSFAVDDPLHYHNPKNISIKNNIFVGGETNKWGSYTDGTMNVDNGCDEGFVSDNNIFYSTKITSKINWLGVLMEFADYVYSSGKDANSSGSDPLFKDPDGTDNILGSLDDDLHLKSTSPAIDAGANTLYSKIDFDANTRPYNTTAVDMGAYEYQGGVSTLPGDIDGDGDVDIKDLLIVAKGYGTTYGLADLLLVARHYGEKI